MSSTPTPPPVPEGAPQAPARITIDHFKSVELRAAKILDVKEHPNADRLWVLTVDVGEPAPRTIVAGIRKDCPREELIDRTIIVVANLEPALLRGVESQGMLLAVRGTEKVIPLGVAGGVLPGTRVT